MEGLGRQRIVGLVDSPIKNRKKYIDSDFEGWIDISKDCLQKLKKFIKEDKCLRFVGRRGLTKGQIYQYNNIHNVWYSKKSDKEKYESAYSDLMKFIEGDRKSTRGLNDEEIEALEHLTDYLLLHFEAFVDNGLDIEETIDNLVLRKAMRPEEARILNPKMYKERIIRRLKKQGMNKEGIRATIYGIIKRPEDTKAVSEVLVNNDSKTLAEVQTLVNTKLQAK